MRPVIAITGFLSVALATAAFAVPTPTIQTATSSGLAADIRAATAAGRAAAATLGVTGSELELTVSEQVEAVIAEGGAAPADVLVGLQRAMTEEPCTLNADGAYSLGGCQALADLAALVASALGGPAALGGTGTVPTTAAGPPAAANGSDYAN